MNLEPKFSLSLYDRYRILQKTKDNKLKQLNNTKQFEQQQKIYLSNLKVADLLKLELMEFGPVVLCFSVYEGFLHYFEGFIYL